ncbi:MAG: HEAT repeat domain-containing protein [Phycisphaerae bacterium]|nr:HEAT repeat domain-containing protein [Phycisphaerae bacterium]
MDARRRQRRKSGRTFAGVLAATLPAGAGGLAGCEALEAAKNGESILAIFAQPTPAEAAVDSINPYDADKRARGTTLLLNAPFGGEGPYLKVYRQHLSDPDPAVRAVAARALGRHGAPEHVPLLAPLLDDEDRGVRFEAARSLQRLHNESGIDALVNASDIRKEPDPDVRAEACTALGQYADPRVLNSLIASLDDEHLSVSMAALESLRTLTGQDLPDRPKDWLAWRESTTAPFAGRRPYVYPVFSRDREWVEYLPFVPGPPNETAAAPVGMPPAAGSPLPAPVPATPSSTPTKSPPPR